MHASAVIFFISMVVLIIFLAFSIYVSYDRLEVCANVQSPVCSTISCPCDGASSVCKGSAYRINDDGETVCSISPAVPLEKTS